MPYSTEHIVERLGRMYFERYNVPIFISETASVGSVERREAWLQESIQQVKELRENGIPLVGYTWWPMFALITWAWRQGAHPPEFYLKQMGFWDLDKQFDRTPTALIESYQKLISSGSEAVGWSRARQLQIGWKSRPWGWIG